MLDEAEILQGRILIVDDLENNIALLEQLLHNVGYQHVTSTTDPAAVRAMHQEHHYDLILLDLQMPKMDGFEVMRTLREVETGGYLPVLVITAQPGHKLRALQAGAKDFVSKPFDLVELQTRIRNMLEVRLLYAKLARYNQELELEVDKRTRELRESEARFRSFTQLSSDWYWEQDASGTFTNVSGPVRDLLDLGTAEQPPTAAMLDGEPTSLAHMIARRQAFYDFVYERVKADGTVQYLQVSGEPILDDESRYIGYRGIGMDVTARVLAAKA